MFEANQQSPESQQQEEHHGGVGREVVRFDDMKRHQRQDERADEPGLAAIQAFPDPEGDKDGTTSQNRRDSPARDKDSGVLDGMKAEKTLPPGR